MWPNYQVTQERNNENTRYRINKSATRSHKSIESNTKKQIKLNKKRKSLIDYHHNAFPKNSNVKLSPKLDLNLYQYDRYIIAPTFASTTQNSNNKNTRMIINCNELKKIQEISKETLKISSKESSYEKPKLGDSPLGKRDHERCISSQKKEYRSMNLLQKLIRSQKNQAPIESQTLTPELQSPKGAGERNSRKNVFSYNN